jgi:hypothetical protein
MLIAWRPLFKGRQAFFWEQTEKLRPRRIKQPTLPIP